MEHVARIVQDPPDVRGGWTLFAYSGMDGRTCSASGFVASLWSPQYDILFHLEQPRRLRIRINGPSQVLVSTGDVVAARTASGPFISADFSQVTEVVPG